MIIANELEIVDIDQFKGLPLTGLFLNSNQLKLIDTNFLWGLTSLNKVNLSYNQISFISSNLFEDLTNLKEINLSSSLLETIDPYQFQNKGLLNIVKINLSFNQLKSIHRNSIGNLPTLKTVVLTCNPLDNVENSSYFTNINENRTVFYLNEQREEKKVLTFKDLDDIHLKYAID